MPTVIASMSVSAKSAQGEQIVKVAPLQICSRRLSSARSSRSIDFGSSLAMATTGNT